MSLSRQLREELCGVTAPGRQARIAETSALLRFGGAWTVRDRTPGWVLDTSVPAVLRRAHRAFAELFGSRPTAEAHTAGGLATRPRYRLRVEDRDALARVALVDGAGHPLGLTPSWLLRAEGDRIGYLRGALMAGGWMSSAGRAAHLEVRAPSAQAAADLEGVVRALGVGHVGTAEHGGAWRLACKAGDEIGRVLALVGAHGSFLAFDEGRLRRQLRGEATRATNADRANLGRAVAASARQVRSIEGLITASEWDDLPEELRDAGLARLANPYATLGDLAGLLGTTRATVHRRLLRLEREAESASPRWVASAGGDEPRNLSSSDDDSGREHQ